MMAMLHRVPARAGDVFLIPGRLPHAIGPGVFMLEVQEPTDWVVQPERFCAGTELMDEDMWGPLEESVGLDCFDYDGADHWDAIEARVRVRPTPVGRGAARLERIVGPCETDCFRIDRLHIERETEFLPGAHHRIGVVTEGALRLWLEGESFSASAGDSFLLPYAAGTLRLAPEGTAAVVYWVGTNRRPKLTCVPTQSRA